MLTPRIQARSLGLRKCTATHLAQRLPMSGIRQTIQQCCTRATCHTLWQVRLATTCLIPVCLQPWLDYVQIIKHLLCLSSMVRDCLCVHGADVPNVLHYGLLFEIKEAGYKFDKHWFQDFDALQCAPWEDNVADSLPKQGLFPFPPHPSTLTSQVQIICQIVMSTSTFEADGKLPLPCSYTLACMSFVG